MAEKQEQFETADGLEAIHTEALQRIEKAQGDERYSRLYSLQDKIFNSAKSGQWDELLRS